MTNNIYEAIKNTLEIKKFNKNEKEMAIERQKKMLKSCDRKGIFIKNENSFAINAYLCLMIQQPIRNVKTIEEILTEAKKIYENKNKTIEPEVSMGIGDLFSSFIKYYYNNDPDAASTLFVERTHFMGITDIIEPFYCNLFAYKILNSNKQEVLMISELNSLGEVLTFDNFDTEKKMSKSYLETYPKLIIKNTENCVNYDPIKYETNYDLSLGN